MVTYEADIQAIRDLISAIFTDHLYKRAVLVIRNLTRSGEENEDYPAIKKYFNKFETVYLFDGIENIEDLISQNTEIVYSNDFIKHIDPEVKIFYH